MVFNVKGGKSGGPWDILLNAATIGLHLVSATFIGLAIGYFLDKWLCDIGYCTRPWMTIIWLLSGIAAGFRDTYRYVRKVQQQIDEEESGGNKPQD